MNLKTVTIADLKPHPDNPNTHPTKQVDALVDSLTKFTQVKNVVIWNDRIIAGHAVIEAAKKAGILTLEAQDISHWDEAKATAFMLADIRLPDMGIYDEAAMAEALREIDEPLDIPGFDEDFLAAMGLGEDGGPKEDGPPGVDRADELREKWGVKLGDIWACGEHRIACGDCTDKGVVETIMAGERVDCLIFDPPWDNMPEIDVTNFANILAFTGGKRIKDTILLFGSPDWIFVWDCITSWYTNNRPLQRGKLCLWYGDLDSFNLDGAFYGDSGGKRVVTNTRGSYTFIPDVRGKHLSDIFQMPITKLHSESDHSHSKPLDWIRLLIGDCSKDCIYDPFIGSGTTLIAAHQLGRICYGIEISPSYVAICLQRYLDLTDITPFRVNRV